MLRAQRQVACRTDMSGSEMGELRQRLHELTDKLCSASRRCRDGEPA